MRKNQTLLIAVASCCCARRSPPRPRRSTTAAYEAFTNGVNARDGRRRRAVWQRGAVLEIGNGNAR